MAIELPKLPTYPGPTAPAAALDQFRAELDLYRAAAAAVHAAAQAATASAMAAAVAAQQAMTAALALPTPERLPTRAELVFELLKVQPQATMLTNGDLVKGAAGVVDAFAKAFPSAVQG